MKEIFLTIVMFSLYGCKSQKPLNNKMEKFDVEKYKKNETKSGQYFFTMPDNAVVMQSDFGDKYVERIYPKNYSFYIEKLFYKNGIIKEKGELFSKGNFQKGIWSYYNESGTLIKEIDYDKPYKKFPWEKLLEFLRQKNIPMEQIESIGRREDSIGVAWYVGYIKDPATEMGEILTIDAENNPGEILKVRKQDFRKHLE